ncbi:MAG: hypothetical protein ACI4QW_02060, partial [Clostridia bacterium]
MASIVLPSLPDVFPLQPAKPVQAIAAAITAANILAVFFIVNQPFFLNFHIKLIPHKMFNTFSLS